MDSDGTEDSGKTEVNGTTSRMSSESSSYEYLSPPENDKKQSSNNLKSPVLEYFVAEKDLQDAISNTNMTNSPSTTNVVGKSIFYDCLDPSSINTGNADTGESFESVCWQQL